jgi:hypothetical protein
MTWRALQTALLGVALVAAATTAVRADDDEQQEEDDDTPPRRLTYTLGVSTMFSSFDANGSQVTAALAGELGYRFDRTNSFGLRLAWTRMTGTISMDLPPYNLNYDFQPIFIGGYAHAEAWHRIWGEVYAGLALDYYHDDYNGSQWTTGLGMGVVGGVDVATVGNDYHLAIYGEVFGELDGGSHNGAAVGVLVRR